jgi:hypothetical protein
VSGEDTEDVDSSLFPTVDSGLFVSNLAACGSNLSGVITSIYAHAGTEVFESI